MAASEAIVLAVGGAHLTGQPLNHELTGLNARLIGTTTTSPDYRLFALETTPPKPAMVRRPSGEEGCGPVDVELWSLSADAFGHFVASIPAPLGIGRVQLADGSEVSGFICESRALGDATEITGFGGWLAYLAAQAPPS